MRNARRLIALSVFLVLTLGIWLTSGGFAQRKPTGNSASAKPTKVTPEAKPRMGIFRHDQHPTGDVKKYDTGAGTVKIDCAYCHVVGSDEPKKAGYGKYPLETPAYLEKGKGKKQPTMHSACSECHSFTPPTGNRKKLIGYWVPMCLICHAESPVFASVEKQKNIRKYPNPLTLTQFNGIYSHVSHKGYYNQIAANDSPEKSLGNLMASLSPVPLAEPATTLVDDSKFDCATCHRLETPKREPISQYETRPEHKDCFACHNETVEDKYKNAQAKPYAADCNGCHQRENDPLKAMLRKPNYISVINFDHDGPHAEGMKEWNPYQTWNADRLKKLGDMLVEREGLIAKTDNDSKKRVRDLERLLQKEITDEVVALEKQRKDATDKNDASALAEATKKINAFQSAISCESCHENLLTTKRKRNEVKTKGAAGKIEFTRLIQLDGRMNPVALSNVSCTGCHGLTNAKLMAVKDKALVETFNMKACDKCHSAEFLKDEKTGGQRPTPDSHKIPAKPSK